MSIELLERQCTPEGRSEQPTPELLLKEEYRHCFELIDGKLVKRNLGAESSLIAAVVISLLNQHVRAHQLGKVFATDCGYQIFRSDPAKVRFPDGSFIARGRLPDDKPPRGHIRIAPDLSIEVVSPNDTAEEVETKRVAFLEAGTRLLWVLYPETRTVYVYRQAGSPSVLTEADELTGEDVVPGFVCRVAELFEDA